MKAKSLIAACAVLTAVLGAAVAPAEARPMMMHHHHMMMHRHHPMMMRHHMMHRPHMMMHRAM